jgi:hypothetical protein
MPLLDSEAISAVAHGPAASRSRSSLIAAMHARKPIATVAAVLARSFGGPADAGVFAGMRRERVGLSVDTRASAGTSSIALGPLGSQ